MYFRRYRMLPRVLNLLAPPDGTTPTARQGGAEETFPLLQTSSLRLEQLVSHGYASPPGYWYDQTEDEWVLLLRGRATLAFESGTLDLVAGDCLRIPARLKHRVERVSVDAVWVALHFDTRD
jgi:cupin 2 domain-containing protein